MAASRVQFVRLAEGEPPPQPRHAEARRAEGEHDPHAGADDPEPHEVQGGHELLPPHS
eukprot:CAMPEP_0171812158 /NCGR_PEP_ID=MMETSP0991-20121206/78537_1 /TAXON_ID=483369 /ORGANISM="non described non described, Strain CCMP2098" /LENGTH=57 /DNA_ID=CAMNT_0012425663 /DNA_START=292 /DNA_END=462 /DNA_ORIENTATION=-